MRSGSRLAREIKLRMTAEKQHVTRRKLHQQIGEKCDEDDNKVPYLERSFEWY
jgi:hypothetical protein